MWLCLYLATKGEPNKCLLEPHEAALQVRYARSSGEITERVPWVGPL